MASVSTPGEGVKIGNHDAAQSETFFPAPSRHRRLADVNRGKAFTRTLDTLAQEQWVGPVVTSSRSLRTAVGQHKTLTCRQQDSAGQSGDHMYSPWGSRCWDIDKHVRSKPECTPRVIKPRRGGVMSRVPCGLQDRLVKTRTNFRSQNGTLYIIQPFTPLPRIGSELEDNKTPDMYGLVPPARDQTFVMLQRIDQITFPAKMYFKSDLNSSEVETVSSESKLRVEKTVGPVARRDKNAFAARSRARACSKAGGGDGGGDGVRASSLALVVARLDDDKLDAYEKCRIWLERSVGLYI